MEMMLILMRKIIGISLRLFLNGDVISVCFFDKCIPRAEGRADATSGRWQFIVSVTDLLTSVGATTMAVATATAMATVTVATVTAVTKTATATVAAATATAAKKTTIN
jgi:hypothetical protein